MDAMMATFTKIANVHRRRYIDIVPWRNCLNREAHVPVDNCGSGWSWVSASSCSLVAILCSSCIDGSESDGALLVSFS